jgi:photosystem II stability/assembly factor-like uncharacterized protein
MQACSLNPTGAVGAATRARTACGEAPASLAPLAPIPGVAWALAGAVLCCLAAPPASAASGSWTPVGPPAGQFVSLVGAPSSPATVYACSSGGAVWRSADAGETWTYAGSPLTGAATLAAVDPTASETLYAAAASGVYKSTDGAATWALLTTIVQSVVIAASAPQTLYGTQPEAGGVPLQIGRSTDGGATWTVTGTLPPAYATASLAVSPSDPATLYALGAPGFLRSSDGGATWGSGFSPFTSQDVPIGVFGGPQSALYVAAARPAGEAGAAVYRSTDNGTTWSAADAGLARPLSSLVVGPSGNLYAGVTGPGATTLVFQSMDRGAAWQQVSSLPSADTLAVGAASPDRLFLLTQDDGIQWSPDQGATWTLPAQPPSGLDVLQVAAGPRGTQSLYVEEAPPSQSEIFAVPVWHSPDAGETWSSLTPPSGVFPSLLLDAQPGVLYAFGQPGISGPDVSADGGASWQPFILPQTALAIAADPLLPGKVAGIACTVNALYLFNFGCDHISLYLTNTFGRGWRLLGTLDGETEAANPVLVRLDPANPGTAFAVINGALWRTVAGSTVLALSPLAGPFNELAVAPGGPIGAGAPPTLYAALARQRQRVLFKSADGGAHWAAASFGLPRNAQVDALVLDPTTPTTLYLLSGQQIFVSDDAAATWHLIDAPGLPPFVSSIAPAVTPPRTLLAGTASAGVFALTRP